MNTQEENQAREVGDRLRQLREKKGKNQSDFAKVLGINQQAYSQIESGKRFPTTQQTQVIIETFEVTYEWLMGNTTKSGISTVEDSKGEYLPQRNECAELRVRVEMQEGIIEAQKEEIAHLRKQADMFQQNFALLGKIVDNQQGK